MISGKKFKVEDLDRELFLATRKPEFDNEKMIEIKNAIIEWLKDKKMTPPNSSIANKLVCFLTETSPKLKTQDGLLPRKKGLALIGNPGTGKTFANKLISIFRGYRFFKADDIVQIFRDNKDEFMEIARGAEPIIVDDIGAEELFIEYGRKTEVIQYLISLRSDVFVERGVFSLFTSNLDVDAFKARYGDRCYSRLKGMCECCVINGEDLRQ